MYVGMCHENGLILARQLINGCFRQNLDSMLQEGGKIIFLEFSRLGSKCSKAYILDLDYERGT